MYTNKRRRKRSTRNTNQDLWRYITSLQATLRNTLYWHTTTASLGFVLFVDYIQTNYGTVLPTQLQDNEISLDAQWDPTTPTSLIFTRIEDCNIFSKAEEEPLTEKKFFALHTFTWNILDCSTCHVIPGKTSPQAQNLE